MKVFAPVGEARAAMTMAARRLWVAMWMVAVACVVPLAEVEATPTTWVSPTGTAVTADTASPRAVLNAGLAASLDDTPVITTWAMRYKVGDWGVGTAVRFTKEGPGVGPCPCAMRVQVGAAVGRELGVGRAVEGVGVGRVGMQVGVVEGQREGWTEGRELGREKGCCDGCVEG